MWIYWDAYRLVETVYSSLLRVLVVAVEDMGVNLGSGWLWRCFWLQYLGADGDFKFFKVILFGCGITGTDFLKGVLGMV